MCVSTGAYAGGYRVALQGQNALGMGHTGVAVTESAETVFFNPAGMSFLESNMSVVAGATLIDGVTKYQNHESNVAAETDNPIGTPVNFYITKKLAEDASVGIGLYTPYGNTVEWEKDWAGSHLVNKIELKTIYIQPTLSVKVNDKLSIGWGPTYVTGDVEFNRNLSSAISDANGDRANVTVNAEGIDAWGFNAGLLAQPVEKLSIGVSYRSKVELKARDEKADFESIPATMEGGFFDTTFDADLVLPAELTVGVSYKFNSAIMFAFDMNRTYWGEYENLDLQFNNAAGESFNPRNYEDANIYRIGVQYSINNDLIVRAGAYLDQSPIRDGYYTPETARNDSIGYTAGASYNVTNNMALDFSLLILTFDEFNGSYDHVSDPSSSITTFGGDYKSSVAAVGFGLNYNY